MNEWISVKDKLPKEMEDVLVVDFKGEIWIAKIEYGISLKEREKMERGEIENRVNPFTGKKRSEVYTIADECNGVQEVPYCWWASPACIPGQNVAYWMSLPEPPEDKRENGGIKIDGIRNNAEDEHT